MRIIFVRHGEPDYEKDCLTKRGRLQAMAAAERLKDEGISRIYSSPMGRAMETAGFTAELLGLPIVQLPFMPEITWGGRDVPENGHPWTISDLLICEEDFDFYGEDWKRHPYFADNPASDCRDYIAEQFDLFLEKLGYRHEGTRFLCGTEQDETIALFSHGGSGACVLAHLLSLPFPYVLTVLPYDFTSLIILNFPVRKGKYVHPRVELFNDTAHTRGISDGLVIQKELPEL